MITEAGKRLLGGSWKLGPGQPLMADHIAAIEAEAIEAERERISRKISVLYEHHQHPAAVIALNRVRDVLYEDNLA